jgi:GrpB-like predicted nucleotidyltransferase (UPF0157 family)
MKIEVIAYNLFWRVKFADEKTAISRSLGEIVVHIHHIGSTSVEGLAAKPIIDILLEVTSLDALDLASSKLNLLGYEGRGELGIPRRRFFLKGKFYRTHQIHAFKEGDSHVLRHLAFRDYLIAHPPIAAEYADLKKRLAATCNDDIDVYCDGKDDFVKFHETEALEWLKVQKE